MRHPLLLGFATLVVAVPLSGWLLAAESRGTPPAGRYQPRDEPALTLGGADADARRRHLVHTARPSYPDDDIHARRRVPQAGDPLTAAAPACRFLAESPTGTSAKFDCVLDGGEVVKVKYGRNPEIHAEAAATRLLAALGYPADVVAILPRIRCYGCPRFPFVTMKLLSRAGAAGLLSPHGYESGYTDFEWVGVERKFQATAIETATDKGWAWWELERSQAPRAEIDAFALLAVFLAHWDNKAENQRLVCLDVEAPGHGPGADCSRPLLMIQDLGATFGPTKVSLARWRDLPLWSDARTCAVSMHAMPFHGGTFPDTRISEAGRALLASQLARLSAADIRTIFAEARFPEFHKGTDDGRDLDAWVEAFRHRAGQVANAGPCD